MKNKFHLFLILCFLFNMAGYSQSTVFESLSFESNKLGRKVSYSIYLPSDYNTSKRNYPVLYLLHGYTDNETNWIQMGQMKTIADRAIANEEAVPMIIVMPDAWDTWYINQYDGKVPYEDMFFEELIPHIEKTYRARSNKEFRAIAGLSMGGYGCAFHAFKRPEMFSSCFAMSAAFTVTGSNRPPIAPLVTERTEAELADFPAFVMECGTEDFAAYPMNNTLNSILEQTTLDYIYTTRPGRHDWAFWQECLPKALKLASDNFE